MASTQIRVQDQLLEKIDDTKWLIKSKLRVEIQNVDILNALILYHLNDLTENEVLEYRKTILGKEE